MHLKPPENSFSWYNKYNTNRFLGLPRKYLASSAPLWPRAWYFLGKTVKAVSIIIVAMQKDDEENEKLQMNLDHHHVLDPSKLTGRPASPAAPSAAAPSKKNETLIYKSTESDFDDIEFPPEEEKALRWCELEEKVWFYIQDWVEVAVPD